MTESFIPNRVCHATPSYNYLDYLNSDNKEFFRVSVLALSILFAIGGGIVTFVGPKYLPELFTTANSQAFCGCGVLGISLFGVSLAFAIPRIVKEIKLYKIKKFVVSNYLLVETNLDTLDKDLIRLLKKAKLICFTERHTSKDMKQKNKQVIEGLWDYSSLLLSESACTNSIEFLCALQQYSLDMYAIHAGVCWDKKDKTFGDLMQKQITILCLTKYIIQLGQNFEQGKILEPDCEEFKSKLHQESMSCSELEKIEIKSLSDPLELYDLIRKWTHLIAELTGKVSKWIQDSHQARQTSLVQHAEHFKQNRQFLIAGTSHLTKKESKKWVADQTVSDGLKKIKIPYIILHACDDLERQQCGGFWQETQEEEKQSEAFQLTLSLKTEKQIEDSQTFFTHHFESQEKYQESVERILHLSQQKFSSYSDVLELNPLATKIIAYLSIKLAEKITNAKKSQLLKMKDLKE